MTTEQLTCAFAADTLFITLEWDRAAAMWLVWIPGFSVHGAAESKLAAVADLFYALDELGRELRADAPLGPDLAAERERLRRIEGRAA